MTAEMYNSTLENISKWVEYLSSDYRVRVSPSEEKSSLVSAWVECKIASSSLHSPVPVRPPSTYYLMRTMLNLCRWNVLIGDIALRTGDWVFTAPGRRSLNGTRESSDISFSLITIQGFLFGDFQWGT